MSEKAKVYNQKGEVVEEIKLPEQVFGVDVNADLIHQALVTQRANQRQVLAHTKNRSEVRGGGKKPWKQKGTGRARAGSNRSPIWIGGGITFGPTKFRNFAKKINKKMKKKALAMALSDKFKNNNLLILDKIEIDNYKTKAMDEMLNNLETKALADKEEKKANKKRSILIIDKTLEDKVKKSGRNLEGVELINSDNINILSLLKYKQVILMKDMIANLESSFSKIKSKSTKA